MPVFSGKRHATLRMKRDRKLIHKMELTRLQRHFEACAKEIEVLEKSKTSVASAWALVVGILGTAFMAGATFAVTHEPPMILLCIILAFPGSLGGPCPIFCTGILQPNGQRRFSP